MDIANAVAGVAPYQLALVAAVALFASVIGGVAGYGTGALVPLVLVPLVGAEPVVPIIAISALLTNTGRAAAFRRFIDRRRVLIVLAAAVPTCILGAYGYTRLTNTGAMLVIGVMLILTVPLRRLLRRGDFRLGESGLAAGAAGYGVLVGGTAGSGVILLSLLMAAGLEGAGVVATDAAVSIVIAVARMLVFGLAGVVSAQVIALALLIGGISLPGAFLAKALVARLPLHVHAVMLDAVVLTGGAVMVVRALRLAF
ncbi:MAG: TSUP family transporter [Xanthobacteraceae bacterium]